MSGKSNPKLIGGFVLISAVLAFAMVVFFGSANFFGQSTRFILFFDQSVNGLMVGSPVKFRGVPIGTVDKIMIRARGQDPESTAIPVVVKIDRSRLKTTLGISRSVFDPTNMEASIRRGLVGQLNLESFITGQLFVEFSFEPERAGDFEPHLDPGREITEIPTLASSLDQITGDAAQLIAELGQVEIGRLNENVQAVLENLAEVLEGIDSAAISRSLTRAADEVTAFVRSGELERTLSAARETLTALRETARSLDLEQGAAGEKADALVTRLDRTLDGFDKLLAETEAVLGPGSGVRYEFENALREISETARAVRVLADYLERNPNALLTGRPEEEK